MKNAFGINVSKLDATVHPLSPPVITASEHTLEPTPTPGVNLQNLKAQAKSVLADDDRVKPEVEQARRVLLQTSRAASGALQQLEHTEQQLEEKWSILGALL